MSSQRRGQPIANSAPVLSANGSGGKCGSWLVRRSYRNDVSTFPCPWTAEEYRGISYIVRDANNFPVAYVYFDTEPGRRAAANLMTKDEARKIAAGIAKLPELLK
jgi:hypothetical protein